MRPPLVRLRKKPLKVDFEDKKKNRAVFGQLTHAAEPEDKVDFLAPEIYLVAGAKFKPNKIR